MEILKFEYIFRDNNGVPITKEWVLWKKPLQLWNMSTQEEINFNSLSEVYDHVLDGKTVRQIIDDTEEITFEYRGGRGASSGRMIKGFGHASGADFESGFKAMLYNVEFNGASGAIKSYDNTLALFQQKYGMADHEYGASVDERGYVYYHVEGSKHSVRTVGMKDTMFFHNHPSGSNFSDADLLNTAMSGEKGIVATGHGNTYTFIKGSHFDATGFAKAVNNAKRKENSDYNQWADQWLTKNQKKYGYSYSAEHGGNN